MDTLTYLKLAGEYSGLDPKAYAESAKIGLITNFTDTVLQKFLTALSLENGIYPKMFAAPYRRYHFDLADTKSALYKEEADIWYIVLDLNPYASNEFHDDAHTAETLKALERFAEQKSHVVICTLPLPALGAYGILSSQDPHRKRAERFNEKLRELASERSNISVFDLDNLMRYYGERNARDFRALYAFDMPFSNEFLLSLSWELISYLLALRGKAKKCLVLDLDNTLWGGIVGEVGALGIELGPGYPGLAYQNFQRALLSYRDRGILLAIASKNNPADVDEVFEKNKEMLLSKGDFAAIRVNWLSKSENISSIAKELNIGLDSIVFLDDDAANREEVKSMLPDVVAPDLPLEPEHYAEALFLLPYFNQLSLTDEDRKKNKLYQAERERRAVMENVDPLEYLKRLNVTITIHENDIENLARVAQLTQKTNQFNLTTNRYSEVDISHLLSEGGLLFTARAADAFGDYGLVAVALVRAPKNGTAQLDTFLMSCRAFSRGVEFALMSKLLQALAKTGITRIEASFIPTAKNEPAKEFLPSCGFTETAREGETVIYERETSAPLPEETAALLSRVAVQ